MPPALVTLIVNLMPAVSVVAFGWSAFTLVLLYWFENIIVGIFNVLRMLVSGFTKGGVEAVATILLTPFFVFHYGLFCLVHGIFIVMLFGGGLLGEAPAFVTQGMDGFFFAIPYRDPAFFWNAILLIVFHLFIFLRYWIGDGIWRQADPITQMFAPYPRIVVVHLTIMIAGLPVILLGQPIIAVLCLALLKTGLETGRMRVFDMAADNPRLAEETRERLKALRIHARH